MTQETIGEAEAKKLAKTGIGTKETEALGAKAVTITGYRFDKVKFDDGKESLKLVLICQHPDREDPIELSKAKILKGDKVETNGLWFKTDEDGKIGKNSTVALTLKHFSADKVEDLEGKKANTEKDESGYLVVKAY